MKNAITLIVYLCAINIPSITDAQPCHQDGLQLMYSAKSKAGRVNIWEGSPSSSSSQLKIEKFRNDGTILWTAEAERGCTQGVSRCYMRIPFNLDGMHASYIEAEMNWETIDGQSYMLMSHLTEKIIYTYFKSHPFKTLSLRGFDEENPTNLEEKDYELPNLYQSVCTE